MSEEERKAVVAAVKAAFYEGARSMVEPCERDRVADHVIDEWRASAAKDHATAFEADRLPDYIPPICQ